MIDLPAAELDRLLLALLDDVITATEYRVLEDAMLASKAARDRYLELSALQNLLELTAQAPLVITMPDPFAIKGPENQPLPRRPSLTKPLRLTSRRSLPRQARRGVRIVTKALIGSAVRSRPLLVTAALLIGVVTVLVMTLVSSKPVAKLVSSRGSVFTVHPPKIDGATPGGKELVPGSSVELTQGTVELTFPSGVRGVFQAPETITITNPQHIAIKRGAAWFHVPSKAVGFMVDTPQLRIVDLGTEFGVVSRQDGADEIHVLNGKVEAMVRNGTAARETLVAGESRLVSRDGTLMDIETKPELFLTNLPATLPYLHWSFDGPDFDGLATDGSHPAAGHVATNMVSPGNSPAFTRVLGKFGQALSSPGKDGYFETDWPGIEGNAPRTVAYWLKVPPGQQCVHPVVGWGARNLARPFFTYIKTSNHGAVAAVSFDSIWLEGGISIDDDQWHHIAVVYTGRSQPDGDPEVFCYVDGRLDRMTRHTPDPPLKDGEGNIIVDTLCSGPEAIPLTLFTNMRSDRAMASPPITLAMDELYVFAAALSPQQVSNLFLHNQSSDLPSTSPKR